MSSKIFVLSNEGGLTELVKKKYENENAFQLLIEKYPAILAGDQIQPDNPRRWIFISREMGVPAEEGGTAQWYLDHLFIDQDGIPTLVEVKRSTDTRIRREVVAQMLDYAANAVEYWPVETLVDGYENQLKNGRTPSLEDIGITALEEDEFWESVQTNLRTGKIRMLFVADEISFTLRRIIEFLNNQMTDAEVLGLEIKQYLSEGGMTTLVPDIIGNTTKAIQTKRRESREWDEASFLEDVNRTSGLRAQDVCLKLLRGFENLGCTIWWGHGKTHGSFVPVFVGKQNYQFCSVYPWNTRTLIEIYFQYLKSPFDTEEFRYKLKSKLEEIEGVKIPEERLNKRPNFEWNLLENSHSMNRFIKIFSDFIDEIKKYENDSDL